LIDLLPETFYIKDLDGRFLVVNEALAKQWGKKNPSEMLGLSDADLFPAELAAQYRAEELKVFAGEPLVGREGVCFFADGREHSVLTTKVPYRDNQGQICGLVGFGHDITERKRVEAALQEAGERFQLVTRATNDAVWDWNLTGPAWWNDTFYEVYGFDRNSPPSFEAWASHIHPDDQKRVMTRFRAVVEHGEAVWSDEFRFRRADGTYGYVMDRAYGLRNASGKTVRMIGSMLDITERKVAEQALRESGAELLAILESTGDGILAVDRNGEKVIKTNRRYAEMWRVPQSIIDAGDNNALRNYVLNQLADPDAFLQRVHELYGTDTVAVDTLVFKDGRIFERHGFPMMLAKTVIGRVWSFRDVTERKRQERELSEKSTELERFTYTVSHDLKSPLVTVKTFLGYLEQDLLIPDPERVKQDVGFMRTAADKMGQLLDELLNLARVGRKSNPSVRVTFQELAQEAVRLVAGRISTQGVEVQVADAAVVLEGDRPRLVEIWQNLVENACKFMGDQPKPRVEIGIEKRGAETVFFVRDNGAGIEPRYQEKVFSLFEKLNPKIEGTGMGLALVKRVVELYKGRIWVESGGPGQGANFLFTLPAAVIVKAEKEQSA
jgi:PAS domain S-box-containing protein